MLIKKNYSLKDLALWTRWETLAFVFIALVPAALFEIVGLKWLQLPWTPIALVGTAVAFLIGFQNNSAYDRIWEARKIWGGIVNTSRTLGIMVQDTVTNEYCEEKQPDQDLLNHKQTIVYRHIAWMTALRHAMRQDRPWEVFHQHKTNREWQKMMHIPEKEISLDEDLKPLLSEEELSKVLPKTNKATALLTEQSRYLRMLKEKGIVWEFSFLELEGILKELFDLQGKSERIKNFPYPRQYATLNHYFVWVFIVLLPFGVIPEFASIGTNLADAFPAISRVFVWMAVPFTVIVSWIFHTMQRIGTVGENPFEGSANDVPISTIARGIEIDLREMLGEDSEKIPEPLPAVYDVQM